MTAEESIHHVAGRTAHDHADGDLTQPARLRTEPDEEVHHDEQREYSEDGTEPSPRTERHATVVGQVETERADHVDHAIAREPSNGPTLGDLVDRQPCDADGERNRMNPPVAR